MSSCMLKLSWYVERLDELGFPISQELGTDLVLILPSIQSYNIFIMNCNKHEMEKSMGELVTHTVKVLHADSPLFTLASNMLSTCILINWSYLSTFTTCILILTPFR